jgi:hypothetical protein
MGLEASARSLGGSLQEFHPTLLLSRWGLNLSLSFSRRVISLSLFPHPLLKKKFWVGDVMGAVKIYSSTISSPWQRLQSGLNVVLYRLSNLRTPEYLYGSCWYFHCQMQLTHRLWLTPIKPPHGGSKILSEMLPYTSPPGGPNSLSRMLPTNPLMGVQENFDKRDNL